MSYERKISRQFPGLIALVVDDSGSMGDGLPGTSDPKYVWVERLAGHILKELLARCTEVQGDQVVFKPRYYLLVIVYGSHPQIWGSQVLDIQTVLEKYSAAANSFGLGGKLEGTDTAAALQLAYDHLKDLVVQERFRDSFPPLVFHLTDGESNTDATEVAEKIRQLSTKDGQVVLVNAYIGTQTDLSYQGPEDFPGYVHVSEVGPKEDNIRMFNMSSVLPECLCRNLIHDGIFPNLRESARAFFDVRTKEMLKHVIQVVGSIGSRADRQNR